MDDVLRIERPREGVALLTLNRPEALNAIDMALFESLDSALADLAADAETRAVVLTGAGGRAFSAGFDIREMAGFDGEAMAAAFRRRDPLFWRVASHPKPVVAALNGLVFGAGALIAAAADIRIGGPATRFKVTASSYGAANATWSLPRIVGMAKAKEILFTGREVGADEALAIGLLNQALGATDEVAPAAVELAAQIAANPPEGVAGAKVLINDAVGRSLEAGYRAEYAWLLEHLGPEARSGGEMFQPFLGRKA